jgi:hypothetical protein
MSHGACVFSNAPFFKGLWAHFFISKSPLKVDIMGLERNHSLRSGKMPFSPTIPFIVAPV